MCRQKLFVKTSSRRRRVKIVFVIVIPGYGGVTRSLKQCCRGDAGDRHAVVMLYLSLLQMPFVDRGRQNRVVSLICEWTAVTTAAALRNARTRADDAYASS